MGLIYGMGHAVYTISDPRQKILKGAVKQLAEVEGFHKEFDLYAKVEQLAPEVIGRKRKIYKGVASNVDFYSGLLYSMLDIPCELYTPLFATARIAGWSAHRLEEGAYQRGQNHPSGIYEYFSRKTVHGFIQQIKLRLSH